MTGPILQDRENPTIAMVGTAPETMGGISTVVKGYIAAGLFDRVPIIYVKTHGDGSFFAKMMFALKGYLNFAWILIRGKAHIVHIHLSSRASFWRKLPIVLAAKAFRKPVLLHLHGSEFMTFYDDECGPIRKRIVTAIFHLADIVIVLSPQWEENVRRIAPRSNVRVIFNGVPVAEQLPERPNAGQNATIIFLGRLGRRKGIYDLLNALAEIKRRGTEFRLIAAGDGEIPQVIEKARDLGLTSYVEVPGWIDEERKAELLAQSDVFVLPSHAEGLPMSLLEALAAGLPVVCSSVGGIPTAIADGSEGFVVEPGDVDALANALNRLLTDPDLREKLGRNAFARAKNEFDVQRIVNQLIALYERQVPARA